MVISEIRLIDYITILNFVFQSKRRLATEHATIILRYITDCTE